MPLHPVDHLLVHIGVDMASVVFLEHPRQPTFAGAEVEQIIRKRLWRPTRRNMTISAGINDDACPPR
jgi:hypothetical protein